jgi:hypothetical protein
MGRTLTPSSLAGQALWLVQHYFKKERAALQDAHVGVITIKMGQSHYPQPLVKRIIYALLLTEWAPVCYLKCKDDCGQSKELFHPPFWQFGSTPLAGLPATSPILSTGCYSQYQQVQGFLNDRISSRSCSRQPHHSTIASSHVQGHASLLELVDVRRVVLTAPWQIALIDLDGLCSGRVGGIGTTGLFARQEVWS